MLERRVNRRQLITSTAGLAVATTGRSTLAQETEVRRGGVPLIALPRVPERLLDPASDHWESAWLRSLIYDTPLRVSSQGEIVAGAGIDSGFDPDARVLDISPRTGVLFSTGDPVTAGDIARSIERAFASSPSGDAWRWEYVERVEVTADDLVRVRLTQFDATLPATLASALVPVATAGAGHASAGFDNLPAGSGPFVPTSEKDGVFRFRPNRVHWVIGQPRFDGCNVIEIGEDIERTSRLVTGLVDIVPDVPLLDIPLLEIDPGVGLYGSLSRRQCAVVVRVNSEPMIDVRVRQLIASAIDREALVKGATAGSATPSATLFPPEHWAGSPEIESGSRGSAADISERLAELGFRPGWPLRLICPGDVPALANTAILLQEQLAEVGIAVSIDLLAADAMASARASDDFDLMMAYLPLWNDPHEIAQPWLHSKGASNASGFHDVRVDRLLDLARSVSDRARRGTLYGEVQRIVADQVPLIPLFATPWLDGVRSRIAAYSAHMPPSSRGVASAWFTAP